MIYCYAKAEQVKQHAHAITYNDVAVVKAISKRSALKKFGYLYDDVDSKDVKRIKINSKKVTILTDY